MSSRTVRSRFALGALAVALTAVSACSGAPSATDDDTASGTAAAPSPQEQKDSAARVVSNIPAGASDIDLQRKLKLRVASGTFEDIAVTTRKGAPLAGTLSADKTRWVSQGVLASGTRYKVAGTAVDDEGLEKTYAAGFRTRTLTLDEQTYPSFVGDGQTVGVGMPVMIRFDVPVTDKAEIEKHLEVTSKPAQVGAFHWISDQEVHWRPRTYWKPGTQVSVNADIGGVPAGNGIYGQMDRSMKFTVGDAMVSKVDMQTHQMKVFRNGQLLRTIPITTGEQPLHTTRTGTKIIVEKFRSKTMNSETVGIDPNSADGYNIDNVEYAMRLTYSGEFIHAAPWSVGSQGYANVSHGCTGMSTANAGWLYNMSKMGDVVTYTGSDRPMDLTNGFGDWNESFRDYKQGSALS
ncbi:Lipoprotein-anchoring transpeptidase ErfK/SrfK [Nocardioides scoriae]|uniref:Lipoprotein-anchoring transpeptidase ErfK/SrfK n=1 Tax=Nocardioides scoriae TaxID=642780 RepID=A0A1H1MJP6_9ACTN|nr:Lipoprotein-anchoring transpeptidase ErfK/SrfK [Nocardioides scoriae]